MIVASCSVTIARSVPDVFRFVGEQFFEHATQWSPTTVQLKKTAPGSIGLGTTGYEVQTLDGKSYDRHFAVREWRPFVRFRMISMESEDKERYQCTYSFEPYGSGTLVTMEVEFDRNTPKFKFLRPLAERELRKDLEYRVGTMLKRSVERALNGQPKQKDSGIFPYATMGV
ncbi:MAG: SRPBCC family protein [Capsulimonadaceae bacterium]